MATEAVIGRRFTMVIPARLRRRLSLTEGQRVILKEDPPGFTVIPLPEDRGKALAEAIGRSYEERTDEPRARRSWRSHARR
ncbi:MAG: AbrB/MazE/SpoVT family DNA-binding domain-containing protein [Euryarchaeota archaeon]|nr:AbrB/MazE/SpoVT family DNA-binding domain-containing protein [Euryarchaeota archaeon]